MKLNNFRKAVRRLQHIGQTMVEMSAKRGLHDMGLILMSAKRLLWQALVSAKRGLQDMGLLLMSAKRLLWQALGSAKRGLQDMGLILKEMGGKHSLREGVPAFVGVKRGLRYVGVMLMVLYFTVGYGQGNCPQVSLPINEGFEYNTELPPCWSRHDNIDATDPHIVTNPTAASGTHSLKINCGTDPGHYTMVFGPKLRQPPTGARMTVMLRSNRANAKLQIGVCDTTSNANSRFGFTSVQQITIGTANSWSAYEVSFDNYTGNGTRIAFMMKQSDQSTTGVDIYLDEVVVEKCAVQTMSLSHLTASSMRVNWTMMGSGTVDVKVLKTNGTTAYEATGVSSPHTVNGLQPSTTYRVVLTPQCTGENQPGNTKEATATTLGNTQKSLAYCEAFETQPSGWTMMGGAALSASRSYGGSRSLCLNSGDCAVLPMIDVSSLSELEMALQMQAASSGSRLVVGATDYPLEVSNASMITTIATLAPTATNTWEAKKQRLASYGGTAKYLVLKATGGAVYVDELRLGRCLMSGVAVNSVTANSVTLEWDTPQWSNGQVVIVRGGTATPVDASQCTTSGGKTRHTIGGLQASHDYNFEVYANCDASHCNSVSLTAHTYAAAQAMPLCTDFESSGTLPTNWTATTTYGSCPALNTQQSHSGSRALRLCAHGNQNSNHSMVALPPMTITQGAKMSFDVYAQYSGCTIEIGTLTNPTQASTFSSIATVAPTANTWSRHTVSLGSLTGGSIFLAIRMVHNGSSDRYVWIDDLDLSTAGLHNTQIYGERANGGTVAWEATGCDSVAVRYNRHGQSATTAISHATSPCTITGLSEGATYDIYLQPYAGGVVGCLTYVGQLVTNSDALKADYCHSSTIYLSSSTVWSLPYLEETSYNGLFVSFDRSGSGMVKVGLQTSESSTATFNQIGTSDGSQHVRISLQGHEADGHYLVLKATGSATVSNLRLARSEVLGFAAGEPTTTSIPLSWQRYGTADSVVVTYRTGSTVRSVNVGNATTYTLTGLTAGTSYTISIATYSNGSQRSCGTLTLNASTLDSEVQAGWCEDFGSSVNLPTGWTVVQQGATASVSGGRLTLRGSSSADAIVALPTASSNIGGLMLRADVQRSGTQESKLVVGVLTNRSNASTFVGIDTLVPSTEMRTLVANLHRYNGNAHTLALRCVGTSTLYIDNLSLLPQQVGEIKVGEITNRSVKLTWEGADSAVIAVIQNGAVVRTLRGGVRQAVVNNLAANANYTFRLIGTGTSQPSTCHYQTVQAHTLPFQMLSPLCLSLDEYNSSTMLPYGWTRIGSDSYPISTTATRAEGTRAIQFQVDGYQTSEMLVSPMIESPLSGKNLRFYHYNTSSAGIFEVGTMSDPTDASTFSVLTTIPTASSWTPFELSLAAAPSSHRYIAFRFRRSSNSGTYYAYLDQLMLQTCAMPQVEISHPEATSMQVHWSQTTANAVWIDYSSGGLYSTPVLATTSPYTLTGLTPNTNYTVRVWPSCDNDEADFGCQRIEVEKRTLPNPSSFPYCTTTGTIYTLSTSSNGIFILPRIAASGNCTSREEVYLNLFYTSASGATLQIGYLTDQSNPSSFVLLQTHTLAATSNSSELDFALPVQVLSNGFVTLRCSSGSANVSNICIRPCYPGGHTEITAVSHNSITIEWETTLNGSLHIDYTSANGASGSRDITTSPYTLTGLTPNATYTFTFTASCDCGLFTSYTTRTLQLPAAPVAPPVCHDFDATAYGTIPATWRLMQSYAYTSNSVGASSTMSNSGQRSLDFYTSANSQYSTLALDPLPDTVSSVVVGFDLYSTSTSATNNGSFVVGTMSDPEDIATFNAVQTITLGSVDEWNTYAVNVALGTDRRYIAFRRTGINSGCHLYLDNLGLSKAAVGSVRVNSNGEVEATVVGTANRINFSITNPQQQTTRTTSRTLAGSQPYTWSLANLGLSADSIYHIVATAAGQAQCHAAALVVGQHISLPYCEDFSSNKSLQPEGWEVLRHNDMRYPRIQSGRYHMYPTANDNANNDLVRLADLPIGTTLGGLHLRLDMSVSSAGSTYLEVGYIGPSGFVSLAELHNTTASTQTHHLTLPECSANALALRAHSSYSWQDIYIDNLQLTTYAEPEAVSLAHTGYKYQHISWENLHSNAFYRIEYGLSGFTPGHGTTITTDSCHAVLGPLQANRTYQYYFLDTLGNRFCYPWQFTSMPMAEDVSYCNSSSHTVSTSSPYVLPEVEADVSSLTLVLTYRSTGRLVVGVRTDRDISSTFIAIDTLEATGGANVRRDLSLAQYADTGRFITFQAIGATATISQITLQEVPQAKFHVLSSSSVEVDIDHYADTNFYVEVRRTNGTLVSTHHITYAPYIIGNLQPYTDYNLTCRSTGSTCAPAVAVRTHLDIPVPYCAEGANNIGWFSAGPYTVLPYVLTDDLSDLYLTLTTRGAMTLGVMSSLDDTSTFVALDTFNNSGWQTREVSLAPYASLIGQSHYLAFRNGELQTIYLNLCPMPTATLSAYNTVRFEQPGTVHDYYIHYGSQTAHATESPFYISGLNQNTLYHFNFTCAASDQSCMPTTDILTGVQIEAPFCVDLTGYRFSDGQLPAGWFTLAGAAGSRYAILPIIDLPSVSTLFGRISYRIGQNGTQLTVGVMTDPADESTFTPVGTIGSTSLDHFSTTYFDLSAYEGEGLYVALRSAGSNPGLVFLDSLQLQTVPFVNYSLVAHNSVLVEATDGQPYHGAVRIGIDGTTRSFDSLPVLLTNLTPSHTYSLTTYTPSTSPCIQPTTVRTTDTLGTPACNVNLSLNATQRVWFGPELTEADISSLVVRLLAYTSASNVSVSIGILRLGNIDTTFTPLDTIHLTANRWDTLEADFSRYTPSMGRFLGMRLIGNSAAQVQLISLDHCLLPTLTASLVRHNLVSIDISSPTTDRLWLEYTPTGGSTTVVGIDNFPTLLTLENSTTYSLALRCDSAVSNCLAPISITTLQAPEPLSWCADFNAMPTNQPPAGWPVCLTRNSAQDIRVVGSRSHSASRSLYFNSTLGHQNIITLPDPGLDSLSGLSFSFWMYAPSTSAYAEIGVIYDPADPETFVSLRTAVCNTANRWQRQMIDLSNAPSDAYFVAIRCNGLSIANQFYIDDLHIAECGANHMSVAQVDAHEVTLQWQQTGAPTIAIEVRPEEGSPYTITLPDTTIDGHRQYTITDLSPLSNYTFIFRATCDASSNYCTSNYTDTARLFTPAGGTGCIDPTNLIASYTSCFYGSYANPYSNIGVIDHGYASAASRHTIHYDLSERDPRTGGELSTVPEGASASVRLGNWSTSGVDPTNPDPGEAESIVYSLYVDTLNFDLLIMRYAAVLQDMDHPTSKQPRFSLELLDENNNLLDATCGRADFIANYMLGWNEADDDVLWKDWTTVGIDLTPYADQTIRIRLTTRDCSEGSHYGYSYFTLECMRKSIVASGCGVISHNELTAPSGFNYRWYTSNSSATYSTDQTITVASNNDITYYCDLSFVDNPTCQFTMSAFAGTRFPLSLFDYDIELGPCSFNVSFHNHSTISMDGTTPVGTGEQCETAHWDFGNGEGSDEFHPSLVYNAPGTYQVSLTSTIAGGQCEHTLTVPITLAFPPTHMRLEGPTDRCINHPTDTLRLYNVASLPTQGDWQLVGTHEGVSDYLLVTDNALSRTYTVEAVDSLGCTTQFSHHIDVHPTFDRTSRADICTLLLPYSSWSDTTFAEGSTTGLYTQHKHSQYGCDSIVRLDLHVYDNATYTRRDTTRAVTCDNLAYFFSDSLLTPTAAGLMTYTDSLFSHIGCDSLSTVLLTVHPTFDHHTYDTICSNQSITWGNTPHSYYGLHTDSLTHRLADEANYELRLHSQYGCDSLSTLHLVVQPAYLFTTYDTICDDTTYLFQSATYNTTGSYPHAYTSVHGCDSTRTLALKVYPTYDIHLYDTIYDGDLLSFETAIYDTTGIFPHMLSATFGCDSLRTLHLQRNRRTYLDTVVCRTTLPFSWPHATGSITFSDPSTQSARGWIALHDSIHLTAYNGIDSLVVMTVFARDPSATTDVVHSCDSFLWANTQELYYASTSSPYVVYPQQRPLDTTGFAAELPTGLRANFSHHLAPYSIWCDSVRHLDLTVDYTHFYTDTRIGCDSLRWMDATWYYADTLGIVGVVGSRLTTGPVDTLLTMGGCDSVINLDLAIRHATYHLDIDTSCWYELYPWRAHRIGDSTVAHWPTTETFYVSDTLQTHTFSHPLVAEVSITCDSVRAISLTQMARPELALHDTIDCTQLSYTLTLATNMPYMQWSRPDGTLISNANSIEVSPSHNTAYYALVDYHRSPLCPLTDSLRMRPIVIPTASLRANPSALRYNEMSFTAIDNSSIRPNAIHVDDPNHWSRTWYINDVALGTDDPHLSYEASTTDDTLAIALSVYNGQCYDTAVVLIPILRTAIFAPNVFTPTQEDNSRFILVMQGVTDAELFVYNREGLLVYRTTDLSEGWDGRDLSGRECPQGNYVWKLDYDGIDRPGNRRIEVGTVLLVR